MGRGRPRKYNTPEDVREARRQSNNRYYAKSRYIIASSPISSEFINTHIGPKNQSLQVK
jgi:hypothetical protein